VEQPFQIQSNGGVTAPKGFLAGGLHAGLKKTDRNDLGVIVCEVPAVAAAVYTTSIFQAAPLHVTRNSIVENKGYLRGIVVNSGNANACTGEQGEQDAYQMRAEGAAALGFAEHEIAVASTGVIGELLPMDIVTAGIKKLPTVLQANDEGAEQFCQAILTTDLVKKEIAVTLQVDGKTITLGGAAKGSGMIHPNMATMLGFVTTDAVIEPALLQQLLREVTDLTFNMITVDGDTSTNDMLLVMASGLAQNESLTKAHPAWDSFVAAFRHVCEYLAKEIARDGEGASKLVEVQVHGAVSDNSAKAIAKTVVGSSLVKTAIFGADANWGRIIAAIGRAGEPVNPNTVDIQLGATQVLKDSRPIRFDEDEALAYLQGKNVVIQVHLHQGDGSAIAWGCDLTYDYVRINAAYRT
jgi:glutamate N-acetyltransferase/amino-acid N-acetyltransferase